MFVYIKMIVYKLINNTIIDIMKFIKKIIVNIIHKNPLNMIMSFNIIDVEGKWTGIITPNLHWIQDQGHIVIYDDDLDDISN